MTWFEDSRQKAVARPSAFVAGFVVDGERNVLRSQSTESRSELDLDVGRHPQGATSRTDSEFCQHIAGLLPVVRATDDVVFNAIFIDPDP
ncbi:hypothetical protein SK571_37510 [Lentzea sp. BCCO 10_0798]|uniref:Uncharacterized protein n=1 Tax=Lentzea kristufekii TaxID=3095430 RepID=A0ABU4U3F1_9PSEU|nr:hypothetical protein [Lentzea sp. BCCO 10_0798]MDX8055103.1 hypothetical protein [Lentzea sp. BCCO 10_0798]